LTALLWNGGVRLKTLRSRGYGILLAVLVDARHKAGLTQRQLAARLKRPQSYVGKIEKGERRIDPVECAEWARGCGMTPRTLFQRFTKALERRNLA
jgi:transcriptional regulator with XRE-family HTH domain